MLDNIAALVNADADLVRRGRFVDTTFLIAIDETDTLIRIQEGRVTKVTPGPFITPDYSFALRASRAVWEKFWQPLPPLGFTDVFALVKTETDARRRRPASVHGELALFQGRDRGAAPRPRQAGRADEPALRADHRPLSQPRPARQAAPALCRGGRPGHSAALPAHRRLRHAAVSRPDERCTRHRQISASSPSTCPGTASPRRPPAGRTASTSSPSRDYVRHDPRGRRRARTRQAGRHGLLDRRPHRAASRARASGALPRADRARNRRRITEPYYDLSWLNRPDVHGGMVCAGVVSGLVAPTAPAHEGAGRRCGTTCRAGPACSRATCIST